MSEARLYFVAIVPPEPVLSEVRALKEIARDKFGSSRALRSPVHITLVPPFKATDDRLEEISARLSKAAGDTSSFEVELSGFAAFAPRVIFVNPLMTENLRSLQRKVVDCMGPFAKPDSRPFHAHMTIAFKDLRKSVFREAMHYFEERPYERSFYNEDIVLLVHNDREWQILSRFRLATSG